MTVEFKLGKHVRIINQDHPLFGKTGNVVCIAHHMDDKVWIDMDETPPEKLIKFAGRFDSRHNWVIFEPGDCEEVP